MTAVILQADSEQRSAARLRDGHLFRAVRIALGLLLVIAAGLKLYGLNVTALPNVGWFATPQVQVAAAEWELVLGLWLLSGAWQFGAWLASIGTFLTFAAVSGYFGWIGVASCGCFGAIRTNPWIVFAVDLAAVLALILFRPSRSREPSGTVFCPARLAGPTVSIPLSAAAFLLLLTAAGSWLYGSPAAALAKLRGEALTVEPSYVDFGSGKPGDVIERTVTVYNWTDQPVRLIGGTSDCSCVATSGLPHQVNPKERQQLTVRMSVPTDGTGMSARLVEFWTNCSAQRTVPFQAQCRVIK